MARGDSHSPNASMPIMNMLGLVAKLICLRVMEFEGQSRDMQVRD